MATWYYTDEHGTHPIPRAVARRLLSQRTGVNARHDGAAGWELHGGRERAWLWCDAHPYVNRRIVTR